MRIMTTAEMNLYVKFFILVISFLLHMSKPDDYVGIAKEGRQ